MSPDQLGFIDYSMIEEGCRLLLGVCAMRAAKLEIFDDYQVFIRMSSKRLAHLSPHCHFL